MLNDLSLIEYQGQKYITWYEDEEYYIGFSEIPDIESKIINKNVMTKEQIKEAKKKPLFLNNDVKVLLSDIKKQKSYPFEIKKGYDYDGATIHKLFWRLVGHKEDIRFKIPALVHDVLCENHNYVNYDRYFADKIFERLLYVADTCAPIRFLMFHSVDNFQKFCGWKNEETE